MDEKIIKNLEDRTNVLIEQFNKEMEEYYKERGIGGVTEEELNSHRHQLVTTFVCSRIAEIHVAMDEVSKVIGRVILKALNYERSAPLSLELNSIMDELFGKKPGDEQKG